MLDLHRGPAFGEPEPAETIAVRLECEPSFVALGEAHVAAGANNQAWFFRVGRGRGARRRGSGRRWSTGASTWARWTPSR